MYYAGSVCSILSTIHDFVSISDMNSLPNLMGFLSLICYVLSMVPGVGRFLRPSLLKTTLWMKHLVKHRRHYGVAAFGFGLIHGVWIGIARQLDFSNPKTWLTYFQGITLLIIFTLLGGTSNNWSVRYLKTKWKKLHYLTYLVLLVLPWHIYDKMRDHWSWITYISLGLILTTGFLFILRRRVEAKKRK